MSTRLSVPFCLVGVVLYPAAIACLLWDVRNDFQLHSFVAGSCLVMFVSDARKLFTDIRAAMRH